MPDGMRARLSILPFALLAMLTIHAVPCQTGYRPISGDLLEFWQTAYSYLMPIVYHVDPGQLPEGVSGLRIACVEVELDSLDLFLLGTRAEGETPLLLARGGYRGLYNTAKSDAIYVPEEDEYHILFQMPFSARYLTGCYRWDRASGSLVLLRITDRDASYETLDRADSLIAAGEIAEAIHIVGVMFYPSAYYDRDEMASRLFRAIDRTALGLYREGDSRAAAELYRCMDEYFYVTWDEWVTLFTDAGDFEDCDFSEYMELAEYAMILNNFGFFLEQSGQTQDALVVLEEVLRLDPSRMVAHLNIADAYWEASRRTQAREHYLYYHNMMMERDLGDDIPSRVSERISTATDPLPAAQPSLRVLSEESTGFEMDPWNPVRLDGCEVMDDGGLLLLLSRRADPSIIEHGVRDLWAIKLDPDGSITSLESLPRDPGIRLTTSPLLEEDDDLFLIACTDAGDTLWTCRLERTDEFCHSAFVTAAEGGGWLVSIDPDAESDESAIYFVSASGECVFHTSLGYRYLLDSAEEYCETNPSVRTQHMTRSGDILLGGSVCEYMGSPSAWYTCALDGGTGEPLWKAAGFGLGDAYLLGIVETLEGSLVAVGRTVPREFRDGRFFWSDAPGRPLVVVLGPSGEVLGTEMPDTEAAVSFQSICAVPGEEDGYVVAGSDEDGGRLVILRAEIPGSSPR